MQILGDARTWGFDFANLPEEWWLREKKISRVKWSVFLVFSLSVHFMVVVKHSSWVFFFLKMLVHQILGDYQKIQQVWETPDLQGVVTAEPGSRLF